MKVRGEQETAWFEAQDSHTRMRTARRSTRSKANAWNLFQHPHGYVRMRGEFFYNMRSREAPNPCRPSSSSPAPNHRAARQQASPDGTSRFRFDRPGGQRKTCPSLPGRHPRHISREQAGHRRVFLSPPSPPSRCCRRGRLAAARRLERVLGEGEQTHTQLGRAVCFGGGCVPLVCGFASCTTPATASTLLFGDTYDRKNRFPLLLSLPRDIKSKGKKKIASRYVSYLIAKVGFPTPARMGRAGPVAWTTRQPSATVYLAWVGNSPTSIRPRESSSSHANHWVIPTCGRGRPHHPLTTVCPQTAGLARSQVGQRQEFYKQSRRIPFAERKKWSFDSRSVVQHTTSAAWARTSRPNSILRPSTAESGHPSHQAVNSSMSAALCRPTLPAVGRALLFGSSSGRVRRQGAFAFGGAPGATAPARPTGALQGKHPGTPPGAATSMGAIWISLRRTAPLPHKTYMFKPRSFHVDIILFRNLNHHRDQRGLGNLSRVDRYRRTFADGRRRRHRDFEIHFRGQSTPGWYPDNTPGLAKALGRFQRRASTYDTLRPAPRGLAYGLLLPFERARTRCLR